MASSARSVAPTPDSKLLADRYKVGARLGAGAFGVVHAAEDVSLGREVAVKWIPRPDGVLYARLEREARAAAATSHPNVVQILDVGQSEGEPFVVMERLTGRTLAERIADGELLRSDEALSIARELLDALATVHGRGVVHRDIKPANVVLAELGSGRVTAKLIDFGLARILETDSARLTSRGAMLGSPAFSAPECFRGEDPSAASDLFSLGATLFASITGEAPFDGVNAAVVRMRALTTDAPPLASRRVGIDPLLAEVVDRLLARDPELRLRARDELRVKLSDTPTSVAAQTLRLGTQVPPESAAAAETPAPIVLGGRYRLERTLGSGGMGVVHEARDLTLDRPVAVKLLRMRLVGGAMVERLAREARAAAQLGHPNVVAVSDLGHDPVHGTFVVMELLRGSSLAELLEAQGTLAVSRALDLVLQILDGLAVAHAQGMVHRDIKPENVFVVPLASGAELAKLLDFGIVKLADDVDSPKLTNPGARMGTPAYMAPEQLRLGDVDARADVFAVGAILASSLARPLPAALERVVQRATSYDPAARHADARALRDDLIAARAAPEAGVSPPAELAVVAEATPPRAVVTRRKTPPTGVLAIVGVGLVLVAIVAWLLGRHFATPSPEPLTEPATTDEPPSLAPPAPGVAAPSIAPAAPSAPEPVDPPAAPSATAIEAPLEAPLEAPVETAPIERAAPTGEASRGEPAAARAPRARAGSSAHGHEEAAAAAPVSAPVAEPATQPTPPREAQEASRGAHVPDVLVDPYAEDP
jgi:serine/threonine protein kinase